MARKRNAAHACRRGGINEHSDWLWLKYSTVSKYDKRALALGIAALAALLIVPRVLGALIGVI